MQAYTEATVEPRFRAIGEPIDMLVDGDYLRHVGYLVFDNWDEERKEWTRDPEGTVFFVSESHPCPPWGRVDYAVTCRHVIEGIRSRCAYIRVNGASGLYVDISTKYEDWSLFDETDVAVSRVTFGNRASYWAYPMPQVRNQTLGSHLWNIKPGHEVFFIGLFEPLPGKTSVEAIVRFGKVARPDAWTTVCLDPDCGKQAEIRAHIVEALSWGGESGSPAYIYQSKLETGETWISIAEPFVAVPTAPVVETVEPSLLGMMYGHFELPRGGVDRNTGIAVVIPIGHIKAVLMSEPVLEERRRLGHDQIKAKKILPKPDTVKKSAKQEQSFTQADFEAALKKVARKIDPKR